MTILEYKVVPAPTRGLKAKGVKGSQARFANALETQMNDLAADGWQYERTDTLPLEERQGLTGRTTTYQTMMVFSRPVSEPADLDTVPATALIEDQSETVDYPVAPPTEPETELGGDTENTPAPETSGTVDADTHPEPTDGPTQSSDTTDDQNFTFPWAKSRKRANDTNVSAQTDQTT